MEAPDARNLIFAPRKPTTFATALQTRPKASTPPSSRLSGLNYAMLTESALKKKLRELGIPTTGSKALLIRRHQEWLNIFNSNCDASDALRKSKRELLRELDEWERTQGGSANTKESHVMRKDFDGHGHATAHKNQFDDLIANARKRVKAAPKATPEGDGHRELNGHPTHADTDDQSISDSTRTSAILEPPDAQDTHAARPYEDNEVALSSIRKKVEEANRTEPATKTLSNELLDANERAAKEAQADGKPKIGIQDPFGNPDRKIPMFSLPAEPICDMDDASLI
jgi:E3 ubiquitin-protein ligase RAD18